MSQKIKRKTGVSQNWLQKDSTESRRSEAAKNLKKAKQQEIGKQYIRVPHPTLKNTFILKDKE